MRKVYQRNELPKPTELLDARQAELTVLTRWNRIYTF